MCFNLIIQNAERVHLEDLENMLHESLLLTFNTEIEDGSIEEVLYIYIHTYIHDLSID